MSVGELPAIAGTTSRCWLDGPSCGRGTSTGRRRRREDQLHGQRAQPRRRRRVARREPALRAQGATGTARLEERMRAGRGWVLLGLPRWLLGVRVPRAVGPGGTARAADLGGHRL